MPPVIPPVARVHTENASKLMTQGAPLALAAGADLARAHAIALALYAGQTYRDEPLGTQDPASPLSTPMHALVGDQYWDRTLTPSIRREMDMDAAQCSSIYFWGKLFRYLASIAGNVAAMELILRDTSISARKRVELTSRNYYDSIGNGAFLAEKAAYALSLPLIGAAMAVGSESPFFDPLYLTGAVVLNGALMLATVAWYGKVRFSALQLGKEKERFMQARDAGQSYHINEADVNVGIFNIANAAARVPKHVVAHVSTLLLGAALYAPSAVPFLRDSEYVQSALNKLGGGSSPAEQLYRWSNFSFVIPISVVTTGIVVAASAALLSLGVATNKTAKVRRELANIAEKDAKEVYCIPKTGVTTVAGARAFLRRELLVDSLGIGAAVAILGTTITVYPPTEPHALLFTAAYGALVFAQYSIREWNVITVVAKGAMAKARSATLKEIWQLLRSRAKKAEDSEEKVSLLRRLWENGKATRAIIRESKAEARSQTEGLTRVEKMNRWGRRVVEDVQSWSQFFEAFFSDSVLGRSAIKTARLMIKATAFSAKAVIHLVH